MLETVLSFLRRVLFGLGRALAWPFRALARWYGGRGWILRGVLALVAVVLAGLYGYFIWQTQVWSGFDPNYPAAYSFDKRAVAAGGQTGDSGQARQCAPSAIAEVAADLTEFNVDKNAWISSMILYKLGLFGLDWDRTPFLDNKASFQRGVNQAVRRTAVELVDTLGRVRGTSQIDSDLQRAREDLQFSESTWYFELSPFGPKTPTPTFYRDAVKRLQSFNRRLAACDATFDARADNLSQFMDRVAGDMGSTSAILRERSENHNGGWFDTRADDRFWFAYGQLYAYYGLIHAARADFADVVRQRSLEALWSATEEQFRAALRIQPAIISNGEEAGWIMPTHLATMGFYVLRARSNLVELRQVLER